MSLDDFIPFHRASITDAERSAVLEVLDSGWLTMGPKVAEFEDAFAEFVGVSHAVALNSGTAALHLAFEGLGIGPGDEVIVPTYTFAASAETVVYTGATPVLVDVDPATCNIDPESAAAAASSTTRAIEVVHVGGLPAELDRVSASLESAALSLGIGPPPLVEDAAHAFPTRISDLGGRFAGTIGRAGAYSFYATKTITTGEGGMLVTNDDTLADRARSMRLHGISRDAWKRYTSSGSWYYEITDPGFKDNLTDLAAALGLVQLARADELHMSRAEIARQYLGGLSDLASQGRLILPPPGSGDEHSWHLFMVRIGPGARPRDSVDESLPGVGVLPESLRAIASRRARVVEELRSAGIGTSVHFIPLHLHPLYARLGYRPGQLPAAEAAYAATVTLPIWPGMTSGHVDRVVAALARATQ